MSPSEFELRAALHDGEGDDAPDVDRLVDGVHGRRTQRRVRLLSGAAAVVVVAGAAVGGAVLWGGGSGDDHRVTTLPIGRAQHTTPTFAPPTTAATVSCPTSYLSRSLPRIGSGSAPMFGVAVDSAVVCAYDETGSAPVGSLARLVVQGRDATALASSIEQASTARLHIVCPDIVAEDKKLLAIVGVTADGRTLPVVTTDVSVPNCNEPISNGTAVRYAWKPPAALAARIAALR